jgi:RteC protein.
MHLIGLGMQILEWQITTPSSNTKYVSANRMPFDGKDLSSGYAYDKQTSTTDHSPFSYPKTKMTWTGKKIDLVELVYAWESIGCFNHGHTNIKEIAAYIEAVFNIDLGKYYGTFQEMRSRVNRTAFLDNMIKVLKDRMDEVDNKK